MTEAPTSTPTVTIYALTDPDSGEVHYVGRTAHHPQQRYSQHLLGISKATAPWVRTLRSGRQVPSLQILEEHVSGEVAGTRERYWIDHYRSQGAPLLNHVYALKHRSPRPQRDVILVAVGSFRALCQSHGIMTLHEVIQRTGFTRQHAWNLWHGYTGVGKGTAHRLEDLLGIPYDELMRIVPVPRSKRIRKQPPEGGPSA